MNESFITSYLTFYLKAQVAIDGNVVKTSNPNTILKVIPLGSKNKSIPLDQLTSVDDSFALDFKSFIWGLIFAIIGMSVMGESNSGFAGFLLLVYGALTLLSSFQTKLEFNLASGSTYSLSVVIFEKEKLNRTKDAIEATIQQRYNDTNFAVHTQQQTAAVVDAIKSTQNN